ncbi:hypothetical protein SSS_04734 [Sarcoptes scabiei]|nr:hypothetical protein SSS_04734 [Sarcoptes scabiei]UXI22879.1 ribosome production factor 2 [Sarcoptes scabiei]
MYEIVIWIIVLIFIVFLIVLINCTDHRRTTEDGENVEKRLDSIDCSKLKATDLIDSNTIADKIATSNNQDQSSSFSMHFNSIKSLQSNGDLSKNSSDQLEKKFSSDSIVAQMESYRNIRPKSTQEFLEQKLISVIPAPGETITLTMIKKFNDADETSS